MSSEEPRGAGRADGRPGGRRQGRAGAASGAPGSLERLRGQAAWFINLRWQAVAISATLAVLACLVLRALPASLLPALLACVLALGLANAGFARLAARGADPYRLVVVQVVVDLALLTALLHFSGGVENPLFLAYVLHVIIAGILLRRGTVYALTGLSCALFGLLALAELRHWLPHYTLRVFPHRLQGAHVVHAAHDPVFVAGQFASFSAILFLTAYLTTLVSERLRRSETGLARAAAEATAERRRLEEVLEAVGAGLILLSGDLRVVWFNDRMREWFGLGEAQMGRPCTPEGWGETAACQVFCRAARRAASSGAHHEEFAIEAGGRKRHFSVTTSIRLDGSGRAIQVAELVQDITARKLNEAQVLHATKMAALGTLATGIAHEIGNPLSSLSTRLCLLENRKEPAFVDESVRLLQAQIGRIERIVRGVARFGRPANEDWTACDIGRVLGEVVGLLRLDRRAGRIEIRLDVSPGLPPVMGVKDQLVQLFLNLGINALEAMPGGGRLRFHCAAGEEEVNVRVEDSGPGISEEVRARLFSPFFTTKKDGCGLGLSISASIVHAHGGRIEVECWPGQGAAFSVSLPAAHPHPAPA